MLTLLALAIQAATVSTPAAEAAMKCSTAAVATSSEVRPSLQATAHFMYFIMQAAKEDSGGKPFLVRVGELAGAPQGEQLPTAEAARTLVAGCDRRYPLADAATTPRLPANAFERDMMCLGALSILKGGAEDMRDKSVDRGAIGRIDTVLVPIHQRINDETLAQRGVTTQEAFVTALGEQIEASLELGNLLTVARACGVTGL